MELRGIIFTIIFLAAIGLLVKNLLRIYSYFKVAQPEDRFSNAADRIKNTFKIAFAQSKIFRDKAAGPLHAGIFWGFLVLLFSASEAVIQGVICPEFSWAFLGPVYTAITFSTDIFCAIIIIAILFSFYRRYIAKVPRLQGDADEMKDAAIVLGSIFTIVTSLLLNNAALNAVPFIHHEWAFQPISKIIGGLLPIDSLTSIFEITWWVHILAIFGFMNYLPYSKHFHVFSSIPNVYFSNIGPTNKLAKIDFEQEGVEKFGVVDIEDLSWKSLHDSYSCTHCGRCTSVCPANTTGKELSPREVMVQIRHRTHEKAPILVRTKAMQELAARNNAEAPEITYTEAEQEIMNKKFVGEYESVEALWQCTTCGACMQECPIAIEHVPAIVGMRRSLVMMDADFPALLQNAFSNLENNFSPWAFSPYERADWAEGTGVQTVEQNPDFDVLFWVGCAGSFDDRAKKISVAFSKLMQKAGINFAILGSEEKCNGDVARRAGNEYLADMLIKMNIETLNQYNVKKIVTTCPHCFNTFKNEYPMFGMNVEVIHHTDFLNQLIKSGKLKLNKKAEKINFTYHDSCYLGRYNEIYESPREILKSVPGAGLTETRRHEDRGFCCGAGGAQMFLEETVGKRVNIERTEELLETGANTIALNCPFCMTMITDGIKAKEKEETINVKDISEILLDYIEE